VADGKLNLVTNSQDDILKFMNNPGSGPRPGTERKTASAAEVVDLSRGLKTAIVRTAFRGPEDPHYPSYSHTGSALENLGTVRNRADYCTT
jgi:hypothetical protein